MTTNFLISWKLYFHAEKKFKGIIGLFNSFNSLMYFAIILDMLKFNPLTFCLNPRQPVMKVSII